MKSKEIFAKNTRYFQIIYDFLRIFLKYDMMGVPKIGDSPSGKAVGSGPTIRGFESLIPSQMEF